MTSIHTEGGLWRPRVLHKPKRFFVSEFHVARGGNVYGKPSSFYGRSNNNPSSPESRSPCVSQRRDAGVGGAVPNTGGLVCARLHGATRTGGNCREPGGPAPADGQGPGL